MPQPFQLGQGIRLGGGTYMLSQRQAALAGIAQVAIAWSGVEDWLVQTARMRALQAPTSTPTATTPIGATTNLVRAEILAPAPAVASARLNTKEQRRLDGLLHAIETLDIEQAALRVELTDSGLYLRDPNRARQLFSRDAVIEEELLAAMTQWDTLMHKQTGA